MPHDLPQAPASDASPPVDVPKACPVPLWLETTKVALDFLGKCFYPAILIGVLWFLAPHFAEVNLGQLFSRIQSAKAGGYEFTFGQAEDIGAEIAPLNNRIVELDRKLAEASAEVKKLQQVSSLPQPSPAETAAKQEEAKLFKANSDYTVLVFHRESSRERSASITKVLLSAGFQSSDTETDFSELKKIGPRENLVHIVYTEKGRDILSDIQKTVGSAASTAEVTPNSRATNLKRGDMQIFVF